MQTPWMKAFIFVLVAIFLLFIVMPAAAVTVPIEEMELSPEGDAASIHTDADGFLYVVDNFTRIWKVNPQTRDYLVYFPIGGDNLADIALAPGGILWWADNSTNFGTLDLVTNQANSWVVDTSPYGEQPLNLGQVAFYDGKVWLASWYGPTYGIFSYDETNLCLYKFPLGLYAADMIEHKERLWVLDWHKDSLFKLDPATGLLTTYDLGVDILENAQFQADGDFLWWAEDRDNGALVSFNPQTGSLATFNLPEGTHPRNLTISGGVAWYTDTRGFFGRMDPALSASQPGTLTGVPLGHVIQPPCTQPTTFEPWPVEPTPGTFTWADLTSTVDTTHTGLQLYSLPDGASAYGIAGSLDAIWLTDSGREKLVRMPFTVEQHVYIPLVLR